MTGNELVLNLENAEFLRDGELVNSLIELSKRKNQDQHDWEVHPYTKLALDEIIKRVPGFSGKYLSQTASALNKLNVNNLDYWKAIEKQTDIIAHTLDAKSIGNLFDVFVPKPSDDLDDDVVYLDKEIEKDQKSKRCGDRVLNEMIKVMFLEIKNMSSEHLLRVLEGCSQRNLGDKRLYKEYLYFYIERKVKNFSLDQYIRVLKVLGDRRYTEDVIFWTDFVFPRIYKDEMNQSEAKLVWEALLALKVKCPELNMDVPMDYIESLLKKFELLPGFDDLEEDVKLEVKYLGDLPEGIKTISGTHSLQNTSNKLLEQAQQEIEDEEREKQRLDRLNDPEVLRKKELREQRKSRKDSRVSDVD